MNNNNIDLISNSDLIKLIATILGAIIATLIASVWNFRYKRKELKLTNYYKDRIEVVKSLYSLIVELQLVNVSLFETEVIEWDHEEYKSLLKKWLLALKEINKFFNKNRILLIEKSDLIDVTRAGLNGLAPLRRAIYKEYEELIEIENQFGGQMSYYYDNEIDEKNIISLRLNKLHTDQNITYIISSFESIRISLEAYFKSLLD